MGMRRTSPETFYLYRMFTLAFVITSFPPQEKGRVVRRPDRESAFAIRTSTARQEAWGYGMHATKASG